MPKPTKTLQELEKQIQKEVSKIEITVPVNSTSRSNKMVILKKHEERLLEELIRIYNVKQRMKFSFNFKDLSTEFHVSNHTIPILRTMEGDYIKLGINHGSGAQIQLYDKTLTYFEDKIRFEAEKQKSYGDTYNVGSITADGSNLVLGNVVDSSLNIDNSIKKIYDKIESDGGEEKEELKKLMAEVECIISEIKAKGVVLKQDGIKDRISNHLETHGWFYGSVVSLIGAAVLQL